MANFYLFSFRQVLSLIRYIKCKFDCNIHINFHTYVLNNYKCIFSDYFK